MFHMFHIRFFGIVTPGYTSPILFSNREQIVRAPFVETRNNSRSYDQRKTEIKNSKDDHNSTRTNSDREMVRHNVGSFLFFLHLPFGEGIFPYGTSNVYIEYTDRVTGFESVSGVNRQSLGSNNRYTGPLKE